MERRIGYRATAKLLALAMAAIVALMLTLSAGALLAAQPAHAEYMAKSVTVGNKTVTFGAKQGE